MRRAWKDCTGLTTFPVLDTSNVTNFNLTWDTCTGLTTFPLIDTSSGTNFNSAWINCTGLTSFSTINMGNMTNGTNCFSGTDIGTTSYSALLIDIDDKNSNIGISFNGGNATYTETAVDSGTTDGTTTDKLVDSTQNFLTTVTINDIAHNVTDDVYAKVDAIDSDTVLSISNDNTPTGKAYSIQSSTAAKARFELDVTKFWGITDGGPV